MKPHIAILGAGAAGLAAAVTLAEAGQTVTVFERQHRAGGRIFTHAEDGFSAELGAEFVHGNHPVLLRWLKRAGLSRIEVTGGMVSFENGRVQEDDDRGEMFSLLDMLPDDPAQDVSFAQWLRDQKSDAEMTSLLGYVEGFNAADAELISCAALVKQQHAEDEVGADTNFRVRGGYCALTGWMEQRARELGVEFRFGATVERVDYTSGPVTVAWSSAQGREAQEFSHAIYTLPLSLLQARTVEISPEPHTIYAAAEGMVMGHAQRAVLVFREAFWQRRITAAVREPSFLFAQNEESPVRVFWTEKPASVPALTAWSGGPRAQKLHGEGEIVRAALATLGRMFAIPQTQLESLLVRTHYHDWSADPCALGAYSYVRTSGLPASAALASPVDSTLFFAGEHTDTEGHWGTVHAALNTGGRAARQLLETL